MSHLVLVHTAELNVAAFTALFQELAPDIPVRHVLACELLDQAIAEGGVSNALIEKVKAKLVNAAEGDVPMVMLTCSTIGGGVDALPPSSKTFLRVDRPMAEKAVSIGSKILVAASLETTMKPTCDLVAQVAREKGKAVEIRTALFSDAWTILKAGDTEGYVVKVAEGLRAEARDAEVIVLAQASMAKAAPLCASLGIPILSSPRLGVESAIAAWRARDLE